MRRPHLTLISAIRVILRPAEWDWIPFGEDEGPPPSWVGWRWITRNLRYWTVQ